MNKLIALMVVVSVLLVTGCVTERVYYAPTYTPAYATPVGYYHTSPYWDIDYYNNDNNFNYYGYDDIGNVGYWGMYNTYEVY